VTEAAFAHASEAELARILDYYQVRWEYEPHRFPILWNLEGKVVESFTPDFYLPDLHLFIELTTLKQSLVRKKNRKLRRLRELYPDVNIKLLYARDFKALMLKYGRIELVASLTGPEGQARVGRTAQADGQASAVEGAGPASTSEGLQDAAAAAHTEPRPRTATGHARAESGESSRSCRTAAAQRRREAVRRR
jgi:hypothetical protein